VNDCGPVTLFLVAPFLSCVVGFASGCTRRGPSREADAVHEAKAKSNTAQDAPLQQQITPKWKKVCCLEGRRAFLLDAARGGHELIVTDIADDDMVRAYTQSGEIKASTWGKVAGPSAVRGTRVLVISERTVYVWDPKRDMAVCVLEGHRGRRISAGFSSDGSRIVTTGQDHTARVWDSSSGQCLRVLRHEHRGMRGGRFAPDGRTVVTENRRPDMTTRLTLWDVASGQALYEKDAPGEEWFMGVTFSPDGKRLLAWGEGMTLVWQLADGVPVAELRGSFKGYSPDRNLLVTTAVEDFGQLHLWNAHALTSVRTITRPNIYHFNSVVFSKDSTRMVVGTPSWTALVYDFGKNDWSTVLKLPIDGAMATVHAAFLPDDRRILLMTWQSMRIWNSDTETFTLEMRCKPKQHFGGFTYLDKDRFLLTNGSRMDLWARVGGRPGL